MIKRFDARSQQKRYAMHRLRRAMQRLMNASSEAERDTAERWVTAWGGAIGERRFASMRTEHDGFAVPAQPALRSRADDDR